MATRRERLEHATDWATAALNALQRGGQRECHRLLRLYGQAMNPHIDTPEHYRLEESHDHD